MSDLQERLRHHLAWLQVESDPVQVAFSYLLDSARDACREPLRAAWESAPLESDEEMSIGDLGIDDISEAAQAYLDAVRSHLRGYAWKVWK